MASKRASLLIAAGAAAAAITLGACGSPTNVSAPSHRTTPGDLRAVRPYPVPGGQKVATVTLDETLAQNHGLPPARRAVVTNGAMVARLVAAADALPPTSPGIGNCPADLGTVYVVAFSRAAGTAPTVSYTVGACNDVSVSKGGHVVAVRANDVAFRSAYLQVLKLQGVRVPQTPPRVQPLQGGPATT